MRHLVYLLLVANVVFFGWKLFETQAPEPLVRAMPPLPANVSRLVTLQEQQAAAASGEEVVTEIETLTMEQPPGAGAATVCQALGPFLAVDAMRPIAAELGELGLQPEQRQVESKELVGFWVYLPAMPREEIRTVLATLEDYNDKEYYVGKGNYISLGTFKSMERAERRLQSVRKMGLEATLEERFATQTSFWLDIQSDGSATEQLQRIAEGNSSLQLVDLACY
jgi:hypothetical protein